MNEWSLYNFLTVSNINLWFYLTNLQIVAKNFIVQMSHSNLDLQYDLQ